MCSVFDSTTHNACTLHRKVRKPKSSASSVWQRITQWHNQSTLFTYHHNWTTDVWRPTSEPTLTRYIRCHGVGQKKRDLTWNQITFTSTETQFICVGSRQQLASVSVTEIVLTVSALRHRPLSRVLASRLMPSWHSRRTWSSTLFLSASPTVVHSTSSYFRQCYRA